MRKTGTPLLLAAIIACAVLVAPAPAVALPPPQPCPGCTPFAATTQPWQIQLQSKINTKLKNTGIVEIDGFDNPASTVATLEAGGRKSVCYIDAGSWENWRPDAGDFPAVVLGKVYDGYPDERWLDIRRTDLLGPLLAARIQMCKDKGFDAVDPDNLNGWENDTGFPLTQQDQLEFDTWLANLAHSQGMSVSLKNDGPQVPTLVDYFDFVVVESCFQYEECDPYQQFVADDKAVLAIEYRSARKHCKQAAAMGFSLIGKSPALKAPRSVCPKPRP